ncbi:hypothetical protein [Labilibacter marinus]|uniref:hypothetical protein n=1 Tax=Labilibacter marinus TaxID=1477105 RepID=UPI00094FFB66|nr:hypothetical protein [Labilibacter marinus]
MQKTNLRWEKGLFSDSYSFYSGNNPVGELKNRSFSQNAEGVLNGERYLFSTKGTFKQRTDIFDLQKGELIGNIVYNEWRSKATITIKDKTYFWKYNNAWNTAWNLYDENGLNINYYSSTTKGSVISDEDNPLLLLTGLYVTNYYRQMMVVVMVAVFIPIIMTNMH